MKYYITTTFEMDGHSSAMSIICDSGVAKQKYLEEVLYDPEEKRYYPTSNTIKEEDG